MPPKKAFISKRACDICYAKKTVCSVPDPKGPCERCAYRNLECTFDRERPSKKQRTGESSSDVQTLLKRIQQLESALTQAEHRQESTRQDLADPKESRIPDSSSDDSPLISTLPSGREQVVFFQSSTSSLASPKTASDTPKSATAHDDGGTSVGTYQLGPNWFFNGMPIFSEAGRQWLSKRTDQDVKWAEFCVPMMEPSTLSALPSLSFQEVCDLPDQSSTRGVLKEFLRSPFTLTFPVLDQALFETTLHTAYKPMDTYRITPSEAAARACVLAALSIAIWSHNPHQSTPSIDPGVCAAKANALLMHLTGNISLETLQTILLLTFRFAPEIPPLLTEGYCDLTAPDVVSHYDTYLPGLNYPYNATDQSREYLTPNFPGDLRLSYLKETVCQQLFSAQALKHNDEQLLLHIRKLDDEIECWRLSIPDGLRPALFVSHNTYSCVSEQDIPQIIRRISLQLEYHHLMTVVHTTVRKCTPDAADVIEDLHAVVHSSFDISLAASRSTLSCLRALASIVAEQAFRFLTSYLTTAVMSLFLNIVIHPFDPQAQIDLELLMSAANTLRSIPARHMTQGDIARVQEESKFVMRLVWLGTCAMAKADRPKEAKAS
ncbi:uncharacterized protein N7477_006460 [Penicillium maclennaniae]|uniref:uncharacterized protein n=1 Tax=Penicillium maclennaniae TaxID=1343394 RepID=UPI002540FD55|nr:uncharacterized protein N7477_006460 [Penicillium maclennaniae]KAJ5667890.1 hypothetical protein N7477_006460 [Penicillium maclennaniae]